MIAGVSVVKTVWAWSVVSARVCFPRQSNRESGRLRETP